MSNSNCNHRMCYQTINGVCWVRFHQTYFIFHANHFYSSQFHAIPFKMYTILQGEHSMYSMNVLTHWYIANIKWVDNFLFSEIYFHSFTFVCIFSHSFISFSTKCNILTVSKRWIFTITIWTRDVLWLLWYP